MFIACADLINPLFPSHRPRLTPGSPRPKERHRPPLLPTRRWWRLRHVARRFCRARNPPMHASGPHCMGLALLTGDCVGDLASVAFTSSNEPPFPYPLWRTLNARWHPRPPVDQPCDCLPVTCDAAGDDLPSLRDADSLDICRAIGHPTTPPAAWPPTVLRCGDQHGGRFQPSDLDARGRHCSCRFSALRRPPPHPQQPRCAPVDRASDHLSCNLADGRLVPWRPSWRPLAALPTGGTRPRVHLPLKRAPNSPPHRKQLETGTYQRLHFQRRTIPAPLPVAIPRFFPHGETSVRGGVYRR